MSRCASVSARCAIAGLALWAAAASAQPVIVAHPAGSAFEERTDLLEMAFEGREGALAITVTVAGDPVVADKHADPQAPSYRIATGGVAIVFIDADGDPGTGEQPYGWNEGGGFEYTLAIDFCMDLPGRTDCPIGYDYRATGGKVQLVLAPFADGRQWTADTVLDAETVTVSVPYEAFGGKPGTPIRVHVLETMESFRQPVDASGEATIALH